MREFEPQFTFVHDWGSELSLPRLSRLGRYVALLANKIARSGHEGRILYLTMGTEQGGIKSRITL